jgi:uncharacterized protein (TIGR00730 family)
MGTLADAAMECNGAVIGVIPKSLAVKEVAHRGITELHVVDSMHERKAKMAELADAFIALPGGYGTFEEFCEIVTWCQLGLHRKPCGFLNVEGYFDAMLHQFDHAVKERFIRDEHRQIVLSAADAEELVDKLSRYRPPLLDGMNPRPANITLDQSDSAIAQRCVPICNAISRKSARRDRMRVFLVGGTGFTGPVVVQQLLQRGHEVALLHRGKTHGSRTRHPREFTGDRKDASALAAAVAEFRPDVAVDMIPFTEADAKGFLQACRGIVPRVVALSSIDVYLAFGRICRTELGPIQRTPLTEASALRKTDQPNGPSSDKIAVERIVMSEQDLPATILRLPAIYGKGDWKWTPKAGQRDKIELG